MKKYVTLFTLDNDEKSLRAVGLVKEAMMEGAFKICVCPSFMAEEYTMPYISDEKHSPFYGLGGIEYFLRSRSLHHSI